MYFNYGKKEIQHLSSKDKILGKAIKDVGHIYREVNNDLFSSLIYHILGQQISVSAQTTVWKRLTDYFGKVTVDKISKMSINELQGFGTTFRKAGYMSEIALKISKGEFDLNHLWNLSDINVKKKLSALPGIGIWTAEMILLFCMQRPDVFSFGDLAIHRGLCKLHNKEKIDKKQFEKYRKLYSPYCSVASLYIWEISSGPIEELRDYAQNQN